MLEEDSQGQPVVHCCRVYKLQDDPKEKYKKLYKARLVAKGYTQENGVDYNEVFSSAAKLSIIRLICALGAIFGLVLDQMDIVTIFLYGAFDETIYVKPPQVFAKKSKKS
jgi:hypothetical protein